MNLHCHACRLQIPAGLPYVELTYAVRQARPERLDGAGQRRDPIPAGAGRSEVLLIMCLSCAPSRSRIADSLRAVGLPVPPGTGHRAATAPAGDAGPGNRDKPEAQVPDAEQDYRAWLRRERAANYAWYTRGLRQSPYEQS